jgi:GST-like protein
MDGAGRQHYLAGHDRLEALVHQLDADKRPRDRYATELARLLGALDERLVGRDWVMAADYSVADISLLGWVRNLVGFYEARELVGFDRFLHVRAAQPWARAAGGAARAANDGGLERVCLRLN